MLFWEREKVIFQHAGPATQLVTQTLPNVYIQHCEVWWGALSKEGRKLDRFSKVIINQSMAKSHRGFAARTGAGARGTGQRGALAEWAAGAGGSGTGGGRGSVARARLNQGRRPEYGRMPAALHLSDGRGQGSGPDTGYTF